MRRDVFLAISDPTRREILHMISKQSLNINAITGNFDVTRAAIYKHLKILIQCGLVDIRQQGRERFCEGKLEKLEEIAIWLEQYRRFWNDKIDALGNYLGDLEARPGGKP